MNIVEELHEQAESQAGSPDGLLRLIQLLIQEVEKLDSSKMDAVMYACLLRAYVGAKRTLGRYRRRSELETIDGCNYDFMLHRFQEAIKSKRKEVRQLAANMRIRDVDEVNQKVGREEC